MKTGILGYVIFYFYFAKIIISELTKAYSFLFLG